MQLIFCLNNVSTLINYNMSIQKMKSLICYIKGSEDKHYITLCLFLFKGLLSRNAMNMNKLAASYLPIIKQ